MEGTSLQSQLAICLKEAKELGYDVPPDKILTEVWSGRDRDRPDFSKLRRWVVNRDIDLVIFNSVDRLARDPIPLVLLAEDAEKSGVTLRCLTEPFENTDTGRLILYILGYASKLEAERIRELGKEKSILTFEIKGPEERKAQCFRKYPTVLVKYGHDE